MSPVLLYTSTTIGGLATGISPFSAGGAWFWDSPTRTRGTTCSTVSSPSACLSVSAQRLS